MMRRWAGLMAVVVAAGVLASAVRAGTVLLADGRTLEGIVTLVPVGEGKVTVQPVGKPAVTANLSDVRLATFSVHSGGGGGGPATSMECDGVRWARTEIGNGAKAGRAEINGSKVTIRDASEGFKFGQKNRRDPAAMGPFTCCFVFQQLQGDGEIIAKVLPSVEGPKTTRAGVMICEGLDGAGQFVFVSRTPDQAAAAVLFRGRGDAIMASDGRTVPVATSWVKLTRTGNMLKAYESTDGVKWTQIGTDMRHTLDEKLGVFIGVAATGNSREGAMANFEGIKLTGKRSEPEGGSIMDSRLPEMYTMLTDGTMVPSVIESVSDTGQGKLKLPANLGGETTTVPASKIVRTQYQVLTRQQGERLAGSPSGVLTRDGDFLDGEIKQVTSSQATVSSVAFGLTTIERNRVAAVAFASPGDKTTGLYEVQLQDGSVVVAKKLSVDKDQLVMEEPVLGTLKAAIKDVVSLQQGGEVKIGERPAPDVPQPPAPTPRNVPTTPKAPTPGRRSSNP